MFSRPVPKIYNTVEADAELWEFIVLSQRETEKKSIKRFIPML